MTPDVQRSLQTLVAAKPTLTPSSMVLSMCTRKRYMTNILSIQCSPIALWIHVLLQMMTPPVDSMDFHLELHSHWHHSKLSFSSSVDIAQTLDNLIFVSPSTPLSLNHRTSHPPSRMKKGAIQAIVPMECVLGTLVRASRVSVDLVVHLGTIKACND